MAPWMQTFTLRLLRLGPRFRVLGLAYHSVPPIYGPIGDPATALRAPAMFQACLKPHEAKKPESAGGLAKRSQDKSPKP